ncbi:MAG: glucosaminidase domain-containing protein [Flavobacteriales bacterium]|nr:glucosaminidase domain-containing protein [Flavobacteriales bacterium]
MRSILAYILIGFQLVAAAQSSNPEPPFEKLTREQYIDLFAPFAVKEMLISGVPASITLAQGILESGDGNSVLAREANNHFGIKCHGMWDGKKYYMDDDAKNECFRVYGSVFDSYRDHSEFLSTRDRYAALFELKKTDYHGWAHGLKKAGYATNPKYPHLLIKIIEENGLAKYDRMKTPPDSKKSSSQSKHHTEKPKETAVSSGQQRQMFLRNNVRYVWVMEGDKYKTLENLFQVREWQIQKYNDLPKGAQLIPGERVYLQPKRNSNTEQDYHVVAKGETLRWISQEYGVKLKRLYRYNELSLGEEPAIGDKVWLRRKRQKDY